MKSTLKKSSSSRSNRSSSKKNNRWNIFSNLTRNRLILYVLVFGILGSILYFRSFAATDSPAYRKLGLFQNNLTPTTATIYEKWAGRNVDTVLEFFGGQDDSSVTPWKSIDSERWWCSPWAGSRYHQVVSLAILPTNTVTLKEGAAGTYNSHWVNFAKNAVASGCSDATLRLGWEFNGGFYNWTIWPEKGGSATDYASYYRNIVNSIRSVPGANFTFDWTPLAGKVTSTVTQAVVEQAYPGDAYVDYIGLDEYDGSFKYYSATSKDYAGGWNEHLTRPIGLNWHKAFALKHGKQMTYPEWGITTRVNDDSGGDDNPAFIQNMYDWFNGLPSSGPGSLAYAIYFDQTAVDGDHRLSPNGTRLSKFPNSAAKFLSLFGGSVTTTTPSDTTKPSAPANLVSNVAGQTQIDLSWNASTDNVGVVSYDVYRGGNLVKNVTGTAYSDIGLSAGIGYSYYVLARDSAGNTSSASNTASATTTASTSIIPPPPPPSFGTTSYAGSFSKYSSKSFSVTLPKSGTVSYSVSSTSDRSGRYNVEVRNPSGISVHKRADGIPLFRDAFVATNAGTYKFTFSSEFWTSTSLKLNVTFPN